MPRGRKGEKRIADVIGATVMVARIVTGEGAPRPKNFVRTHKAHKLSPAMAAGLTDKLWDMAAKPPKCIQRAPAHAPPCLRFQASCELSTDCPSGSDRGN
jgi:hypothetical protein